jgi:hypothetical protein
MNGLSLFWHVLIPALACTAVFGIIYARLMYLEQKEYGRLLDITQASAKNFKSLMLMRPEEIVIMKNTKSDSSFFFKHYLNDHAYGPFKTINFFPPGVAAITQDGHIFIYHMDQNLRLVSRKITA